MSEFWGTFQFCNDLKKIVKSDLSSRFQYAKECEEKNMEEIFNSWARILRKNLILKLEGKEEEDWKSYPVEKIKEILTRLQETKYLLSSTNANQRLALELLFVTF